MSKSTMKLAKTLLTVSNNCLKLQTADAAVIVPRNLAKHFEFTKKHPVFCFTKSESFKSVTHSLALTPSNNYMLKKTNEFIRRVMETGLLQKWYDDNSKNIINEENWNGPTVLTVEHIYIALIVYGGGLTVAMLTFFLEKLAYRYIVRNKNRGRISTLCDKYIFSPERVICLPRKGSA